MSFQYMQYFSECFCTGTSVDEGVGLGFAICEFLLNTKVSDIDP